MTFFYFTIKIPTDFGTCKVNEYRCDNGECIPLDKKCDGFSHCLDNSDEKNCGISSFYLTNV